MAKRIWERLVEEYGLGVKESTLRHYAWRLKKELSIGKERFPDLVWAPARRRPISGKRIST